MKRCAILVGLLFFFMFFGPVSAISMAPPSLSEVTISSDAIILGKIVNVTSQWNAAKTHIETTAQVQVTDSFKKGDGSISTGSIVPVTVLGGRADDITETVEGMPILIPGTDAFFFLKKTTAGQYTISPPQGGLYPVTNGQIGYSKIGSTPSGATTTEEFKQTILSTLKGNATSPAGGTLTPAQGHPVASHAGVTFVLVLSITGFVFFFRKRS